MYMDDYKRWMATELEDAALTAELQSIEGNEEEIKDRFAVSLKFGTAAEAMTSDTRQVATRGTSEVNTSSISFGLRLHLSRRISAISQCSRAASICPQSIFCITVQIIFCFVFFKTIAAFYSFR